MSYQTGRVDWSANHSSLQHFFFGFVGFYLVLTAVFVFLILLSFQIIHPKTDDQRNRLQEACKDILLFKNLDPVREIIIIGLWVKNWART